MAQGSYQISVKGRIDNSRSEWFEGWTITPQEDGTTTFEGLEIDQSALHGILAKIRNLNLPLISIRYIENDQKENKRRYKGDV